jgi:hypothetical protein
MQCSCSSLCGFHIQIHFLKHGVSSKEKTVDIVVVTEQDVEKEDSGLRRRTSKEESFKRKIVFDLKFSSETSMYCSPY